MVKLKIIKDYTDMVLNRKVLVGEILEVTPERAKAIVNKKFAKIIRINKLSKGEKV